MKNERLHNLRKTNSLAVEKTKRDHTKKIKESDSTQDRLKKGESPARVPTSDVLNPYPKS